MRSCPDTDVVCSGITFLDRMCSLSLQIFVPLHSGAHSMRGVAP